jgi:hypothetical protein
MMAMSNSDLIDNCLNGNEKESEYQNNLHAILGVFTVFPKGQIKIKLPCKVCDWFMDFAYACLL